MEEVWIHIDNTRDVQKKVSKVHFSGYDENDCWKIATSQTISPQLAGWIECRFVEAVKKIKIELRGPDHTLRVRQIRVFGYIQDRSSNVIIQDQNHFTQQDIFERKTE